MFSPFAKVVMLVTTLVLSIPVVWLMLIRFIRVQTQIVSSKFFIAEASIVISGTIAIEPEVPAMFSGTIVVYTVV